MVWWLSKAPASAGEREWGRPTEDSPPQQRVEGGGELDGGEGGHV